MGDVQQKMLRCAAQLQLQQVDLKQVEVKHAIDDTAESLIANKGQMEARLGTALHS